MKISNTLAIISAFAASSVLAAPPSNTLEPRAYQAFTCPDANTYDLCHAKNADSYCDSNGNFRTNLQDSCSQCYCTGGTCLRCDSVKVTKTEDESQES